MLLYQRCYNYKKLTYGSSIQSTRKVRVQPLAGEPEKNVIRDGPLVNLWKPGHSVANIGLDVEIISTDNRSTHISPIIVFLLKKPFASENETSVWSVKTVLGIIPANDLYFTRSTYALLTASNLSTGFFTFLIECWSIAMGRLHPNLLDTNSTHRHRLCPHHRAALLSLHGLCTSCRPRCEKQQKSYVIT